MFLHTFGWSQVFSSTQNPKLNMMSSLVSWSYSMIPSKLGCPVNLFQSGYPVGSCLKEQERAIGLPRKDVVQLLGSSRMV